VTAEPAARSRVRRVGPVLPDPSANTRLRRYLQFNLAGIGTSALGLAIAQPFIGRTVIFFDVAILGTAWFIVAFGWWAARRGRSAVGTGALTLGTWVAAIGVTYTTPFAVGIGLLGLVAPVVAQLEHLPRPALQVSIVLTILGTGAVCAVAELRRSGVDALTMDPWLAAVLLMLFVPIVATVITAGMAQQMRRLTVQTQELASSRSRLAVAADEARSAIERDLHDGAQQQLVTVSVELGRVARMCERDPGAAAAALADVRSQLQDAIRELRDLAHGIYPALLTERGLHAALPAAGRRTATPCEVQVVGVDRLAREVEAAVYFCCLEALHNADKHAAADRIEVRVAMTSDGHAVVFTVSDDGHGIPPTRSGTGRGLTGMADRVRAAGGELTIHSRADHGTRVTGRIPLSTG
jgi:signal transduction histidine kinase